MLPGAEMAQNLLHRPRVINHRDHAHGVLADGEKDRIHFKKQSKG